MNQIKALRICRAIEAFAPQYGCHVALTGGCLYKDGYRKDLDIMFYRIRQVPEIDIDGLKDALTGFGFTNITGFGWLFKAEYQGENVDMFFPEEIGGEEYNANKEI